MIRLLVTGGNGFIGKHILAALPNDVVYLAPKSHECDFLDPVATQSLISDFRPSHLLHLAWVTQNYASSPENIRWLAAGVQLIKMFYRFGGIRFVGVGSCYEYAPSSLPLKEWSIKKPQTLYGKCKLALSRTLESYARKHDKSWAWCRPFYITGIGENSERLVPAACRAFSQNKNFFSHGYNNILDYMDVRDVAAALCKIVVSEYCGAVNIGSGIPTKLSDLLEWIRTVHRSLAVITQSTNPPQPVTLVSDNSILKDIIKFSPQYSLSTTIMDIISNMESAKNGSD